MSKVEAYRCDYCHDIVEVNECVGVSLQPDLFDKLAGFPIINNCEKAQVHLCGSCYNKQAVARAEQEVYRRIDEEGYKEKLKELTYGLRAQCVSNFNKQKADKIGRK
jgi:hypothetical protein